jgi:hypothetical protein
MNNSVATIETLASYESGLSGSQALYGELADAHRRQLKALDAELAAAEAIQSITRERERTVRLLKQHHADLIELQKRFELYATVVAGHLALLEVVKQKMAEALAEDRTMRDLYEADILLWSEAQAERLRQHALKLDWDNLAEEIEDVGRSQLRAVESHIVQALLHDLKAEAWPLSRDVPHWRAEARGQRADARRHFSPSMRQRIDVPRLYREALYRMPATMDGTAPLPVPAECPVTLEELLAEPLG